MERAKRILAIAGVLVLGVGAAEAGIFGSRKADKQAASAPAVSAIALSAIEIDGSRVMLRTNGAPAYTSYSPSPGVFVVDLTDTGRDAAVIIPATLPPAVASLAAEEVVEMGSRLTRVTFRLSESLMPEVMAIEKAVIVTIPASAIPIETASSTAPQVEVLPTVTPLEQPAPAAIAIADPVPTVETIADPVEVPVTAPVPVAEEVLLPRAKAVRNISAAKAGDRVEVRIAGDGQLKYKAFRLESPSRLVIDLEGVKNAASKNSVAVDDDVVQRVRIAQFQPTVARVVVDLAHKTDYDIVAVGDEVRVAFGPAAIASTEAAAPVQVAQTTPAPTPVVAPTIVEKPIDKPVVKPVPADIPSQVPVIAENVAPRPVISNERSSAPKTTWKVPEPASKGARSRITPAADQAPVQQPPTREDVFGEAQTQNTPQLPLAQGQILSSSRNLSGTQRVFNGEPISLTLKDADIKDVLRTFADLTGLNMAIDPGVGGSVTVDFVDVPWDQALDIILRQNNLTFSLEGNVMRIGTVERIAAEAAASRRLEEEARLGVPLTTLSFKLSYARAGELQTLLRDIASPRARIIVDPRTNQLIVSEIPEYLRTMQNLITTVDIPSRQVMIEARIVESLRTFTQQYGFTWGFSGDLDPALGTGTGLVFPNRIGFEGGPFDFALGDNVLSLTLFDVLGTFDLDLALSAAETQGYAKVVSAPRVTTQDNQAAQITSGFQIPYQTRINFTTTVQYLDATLSLQVTPQITEAGTVIMDISVQKNEPATGLTIAGAAGTPLTTRQAKTRLMVRDGGTAVIAGIFQSRDGDAQSRVPYVHNIPIIGNLFKSRDITTSHDELLIFITPRIVRG
ncbi:MAG TPA: type IV pilus secretin PilQ [Thermoanaerobaculia bacterium]|nr:type IV pilus secretin PilQ [Thermoanaerobaculia bacterium]